MKHLITILFCFVCFNNPELEGCYCSEDNFGEITFTKPDKISLLEFSATGSPIIGYGTYKYFDNKILIKYFNNHYLDSVVQLNSNLKKDSLTIIVRDYETRELIPVIKVNYKHSKTLMWTDINGRVIIPRLDDEIQIEYMGSHTISLKNNEKISGYEVFFDSQLIINKSRDTLNIKSINDSILVFKNGIVFKKNYCKKKKRLMI